MDCALEEGGANRLGDLNSDTFLRLQSRGAEMGGKNQVWNPAQWRVSRQRLLFENIERRPGHLSARQCLDQSCLVDQPTARAIDQPDAAFCFREANGVEEMMRLGREGGVQGEKIREGQELIEFFDQLHLKRARPARGKVWIVGQHPHPEGDCAPAQLRADPTHADDA